MNLRRPGIAFVLVGLLVACSASEATEAAVPAHSASLATPTPSPLASSTPLPEAPGVTAGLAGVTAGLFAEVVTTDLVRRSAPRITDDSAILGELNAPTRVYVEGGPIVSDGYTWFFVNDMETWSRGWVAEVGKDGEVWLAPLGHEAGEWTLAGSVTIAGTANVRGATAGSDGTIYVFGGQSAGFGEPASGAAWAFDPDARAWRALSPMRTPRDAAQVALGDDGRLYVIGGAAGDGSLSTVEVYDPASDRWASAPPAPVPMAWGSAAIARDDELVFFTHQAAWSYNPLTGGSVEIGYSGGSPNDAVVTPAGEIYVLPESGGVLGSAGGPRRFDPTSGSLGASSDARIDRMHATGAVMPDGRILVVGGGATGGPCCIIPLPDPADPVIEEPRGPLPPLPAEAFDVTDGTWSTLGPLPAGLGAIIGAVVSTDGVFVVAQRDDQLVILELTPG